MFESGAHQFFQVGVVQIVGLNGAHVFVGEIDARDAFVIGRERDGHAKFAIERERMRISRDAENHVVTGQIDFDHHVLRSHFLQQIAGTIFVHHVYAVADALGVSFVDCETNVAAEAFIRNEPRCNFSGMQRDANFGIEPVKKIDHAHVQREIRH